MIPLLFSMLVVATTGAGFVLGSGASIDLAGLCWTCTGTMMVAASANSFNQVWFLMQVTAFLKSSAANAVVLIKLALLEVSFVFEGNQLIMMYKFQYLMIVAKTKVLILLIAQGN